MMNWFFHGALVVVMASVANMSFADAYPLSLAEDDAQITIRQGANLILAYNKRAPETPPGIDPIYRRSGFLHPVASPQGGVVTAAYPFDHAHQNGIFGAWVQTEYEGRPVDFWNLAKGQGRVKHDRVVATFCSPDRAGFVVELLHQATGASADGKAPTDILRETWRITCHRATGYFLFDLESDQQAITDQPLLVKEYHYGGMAVRGPAKWRLPAQQNEPSSPPSEFLNSQGSRRATGNHQAATWVAMTGRQNGRPVSIAVLSHKDNFRAPQQARLHPTMPYFCFAPCVSGEFSIDKQAGLRSRYRYLVTDEEPNAAWLSSQWETWCGGDDS